MSVSNCFNIQLLCVDRDVIQNEPERARTSKRKQFFSAILLTNPNKYIQILQSLGAILSSNHLNYFKSHRKIPLSRPQSCRIRSDSDKTPAAARASRAARAVRAAVPEAVLTRILRNPAANFQGSNV